MERGLLLVDSLEDHAVFATQPEPDQSGRVLLLADSNRPAIEPEFLEAEEVFARLLRLFPLPPLVAQALQSTGKVELSYGAPRLDREAARVDAHFIASQVVIQVTGPAQTRNETTENTEHKERQGETHREIRLCAPELVRMAWSPVTTVRMKAPPHFAPKDIGQ